MIYILMIRTAKIFQIKDLRWRTGKSYTMKIRETVYKDMARWFLLLLILAFPCFCFSQFGINARYLVGNSDILSEDFVSQDGYHVSLEYHFRLKQKRLEFRPGAGYRFTHDKNYGDGHFKAYDFDLGVAVYPFDFAGDCHCPTFSKDGELFKKGFFIEIIPGISQQTFTRLESRLSDHLPLPIESKNMIGKIGGAIGLDLGFFRQVTITPMVSATLLTSADWDGLELTGDPEKLDDYMYYGFGLRVIYSIKEKFLRRRH